MVFLAAPLINLHRRSCLCTSIPCGGRFMQAKKEENGKLPSVGNVRISQCKSAQQGETSWGLCWFCWWQCLQDPSSISKSPPTWDWILSPVQQPLTCREMWILSFCTPPRRYGPEHKLGKTQLKPLSVSDKSSCPTERRHAKKLQHNIIHG